MKYRFIQASKVRALAKAHGRRTSEEFLEVLDRFVGEHLHTCCRTHNGGRKTIDQAIASWNGIRPTGKQIDPAT